MNENLGDEQNDNSEEQENSEGDEIYDDNERRRREQVKKMMEDKKQQLSEIDVAVMKKEKNKDVIVLCLSVQFVLLQLLLPE